MTEVLLTRPWTRRRGCPLENPRCWGEPAPGRRLGLPPAPIGLPTAVGVGHCRVCLRLRKYPGSPTPAFGPGGSTTGQPLMMGAPDARWWRSYTRCRPLLVALAMDLLPTERGRTGLHPRAGDRRSALARPRPLESIRMVSNRDLDFHSGCPGAVNNIVVRALVAAFATDKAVVEEKSARTVVDEITAE